MRTALFCALLIVGACGCTAVPPQPGEQWPEVEGMKPGQRGYWKKASTHFYGKWKTSEARADNEELQAKQSKLHWVSGICVVGAFACIVAGAVFAAFRRWALTGAVALLAVAALAWGIAWILPYVLWIALIVGLVLVVGFAIYLRRDQNLKDKLLEMGEAAKEKWKGFRAHAREFIQPESPEDKLLDKERDRIGLLPAGDPKPG